MGLNDRLEQMGIVLPERDWRGAAFDLCRQEGDRLYLSGHGPNQLDGSIRHLGKLGRDLTVAEGQEAARLCAINHLAVAKAYLGDLDRITGLVKVLGLVQSTDDFFEQPLVMNAYSEFWKELLGESGRHARSAFGVNALPFNMAVEVECILTIKQ